MDHRNLIAIDTHTHAEVSCWNPFDNYGEEYDRAADKYFRSSRRPTIQESIDYYRERKIGLVMFMVDAESNLGRRRIPNEEIAEAAQKCGPSPSITAARTVEGRFWKVSRRARMRESDSALRLAARVRRMMAISPRSSS